MMTSLYSPQVLITSLRTTLCDDVKSTNFDDVIENSFMMTSTLSTGLYGVIKDHAS